MIEWRRAVRKHFEPFRHFLERRHGFRPCFDDRFE